MADPADLLGDRTLVLMRHSKAVKTVDSGVDADRPLSDRGRRDAGAAGEWLAGHDLHADLVLCSTSVRTRETWQYAAEAGLRGADVWYDRRIYDADADALLEVIREAPAATRTVLLVGHAPGVPWLADELATPEPSADRQRLGSEFPTSALAVLRTRDRWTAMAADSATLSDFVVPRG
jgi:phosphohistidine phosphatase